MILRLTFIEHVLHKLHMLPTPVMDTFGSVLFGRALSIAVRKGFFELLSTRPLTCEQIADRISFNSEAVRTLAELFVLAGYLRREGESFALSSEASRWLVESSPHYLGNLVRYFESLYDRWGYLEHTLQHGAPPKPYYEVFQPEDWEAYVFGMRDLARLLIPEVLQHIDPGKNPQSLLDIGGSHGLYAVECCRRYPTLQATIMDFESALQCTSAILRGEDAGSRISLLGGDFTKTGFPQNQDVILLFNVIHGFGINENTMIIERALRSLRPRGKLYVLDQLRGESQRSGLSRFMPLIVGLHLMNEIGGTTYEFAQVQAWCAGASSVRKIKLRVPGVTLVEVVN